MGHPVDLDLDHDFDFLQSCKLLSASSRIRQCSIQNLSQLKNRCPTWTLLGLENEEQWQLGSSFSGPGGRPQRDLRPRPAESLQPSDEARAQVGAQEEVRRRAQRNLRQVRMEGDL